MYWFGIGSGGFAKDFLFLSRELSELSRWDFNSPIIFTYYIYLDLSKRNYYRREFLLIKLISYWVSYFFPFTLIK